MSSIISKSAKTTERRAKRVKIEVHPSRPERKLAHAMPNKTRKTASKASRPKVDASANTLSEKPGAIDLTSERETSLPSSFKIIAGSYERLLYGLQATVSASSSATSSELEWTLKPIFIFPAHVSYIKTVAASPQGGKWLATGSGDEIIKVWDLRRRKEVGGLMQHEGSITHLTFSSRSHLVSASEDGTLCIFRARDWAVLRSLKGHKGRVNSVSVHPSGKVALSVGKDRTLYMWDLMRGRRAASLKLGFEGELVRWPTSGSLLIVQSQKIINVYSTELEVLHTLEHGSRIHDVKFVGRVGGGGEVLLVAAEDKRTTVYEVAPNSDAILRPVAYLVGHGNRVKALDTITIALPTSQDSTTIICTVSSDGTINIYDMLLLPPPGMTETTDIPEISPVARYDSKGSRLTCVTLADGEMSHLEQPSTPDKGNKRDRETDSEMEEEWMGL